MSKMVDGVRKYPVETVEILRRIYDLYQNEGRSQSEIRKIIRAEFPQPIEINTQDDDTLTPAAAAPQMVTILDKLDKLTAAFERVATILERQNDQGRRIADLESRMNALIGSGGDTSSASEASTPPPATVYPPEQELELYKKRMRARIVMLRDEGMGWQEIADTFNSEGAPTFSGKGNWYQGTIASMYRRVKA